MKNDAGSGQARASDHPPRVTAGSTHLDHAASAGAGELLVPVKPTWEAEVFAEQVRLGYRTVPAGFWAGIGGGVVFGLALFRTNWPPIFVGWQCVNTVVSLIALITIWRFRSTERDAAGMWPWAVAHVLSTCAIGICWGFAGVQFFDLDPTRLAIIIITLFLLSISASTGGTSVLPAVYACNLPLVLPFAIRALQESEATSIAAGAAAIILLLVVTAYAHKVHALIVSSIRMRYENRELNEALTEQRVLERTRILDAANRHKSEFLANMSHELRTPLNAIIGFSEVLKDGMFGPLNDKQVEYTRGINRAGHHLLALINDILFLLLIEQIRKV